MSDKNVLSYNDTINVHIATLSVSNSVHSGYLAIYMSVLFSDYIKATFNSTHVTFDRSLKIDHMSVH